MSSKPVKGKVKAQPAVVMEAEVARKIRQHARGSMKAEVCGVLVGSAEQDRTVIEACIAGVNAAQGGAHVTFTQDTWEHIYKIKDQQFPDMKIVGWYHSHPGFGVFLSEHDLFIQENFFSGPHQVAWVYDPHTDEEGCFGWVAGKTEKVTSLRFGFSQSVESDRSQVGKVQENGEPLAEQIQLQPEEAGQEPPWVKWTSRTVGYLAVLALGFLLGHEYLRYRVVPEIRAYEDLLEHLQPQLAACQEMFQHIMPPPSEPAATQALGSRTSHLPGQSKAERQQKGLPAEKGSNGKH